MIVNCTVERTDAGIHCTWTETVPLTPRGAVVVAAHFMDAVMQAYKPQYVVRFRVSPEFAAKFSEASLYDLKDYRVPEIREEKGIPPGEGWMDVKEQAQEAAA